MASRRDWQLQQLGIMQWTLRRPGVLQGEIAVTLPAHVRLVMVAQSLPAVSEPLLQDIFRAVGVTPEQVLQLTPERAAMLPEGNRCVSWWLGEDNVPETQAVRLVTPVFTELQRSADARAALWRQICEHENNLFTHPG